MFNWANLGTACSKGMLMAMNGVCVTFRTAPQLLALCVFTFAVVDTHILKQYGDEKAAGSFIGDMLIISICITLIAVATFGCLGAARDNVKILYLYVILLIVLILLELLISIYVAVQRYGLEFRVTEWIREDFYGNASTVEHQKTWDSLQTSYECCGLNGPQDYIALQQSISLSCCARAYRATSTIAQTQMYKMCIDRKTYYKAGCEDEVLYMLRAGDDMLFGIAVISFCFETSGLLLAMWIANNLKHNQRAHKLAVKY